MLKIDYESDDFPPGTVANGSATLSVNWDELLWAAITIGRPNLHYVFMHGEASYYEAIFRLSLMRMSLQQERPSGGRLLMTEAFKNLDPSEKGAINYFLGMVFCKLFSAKLLDTPWLLHLDVFRDDLEPELLSGHSRPDLVGHQCGTDEWHSFESKGRIKSPSEQTKRDAKSQADRLISVGGKNCSLHVASFSYFRKSAIAYYWRDPITANDQPIKLPAARNRWRHYYAPVLSLYFAAREKPDEEGYPAFHYMEDADVSVAIHPKIERMLREQNWEQAREIATLLRSELLESGYQPDGVAIRAGESWYRPFK